MTLQHQQVSPLSSIECTDKNIGTGLDFILSHFEDPLFPRKVSTYKTKGGQFFVSNKQDIINAFRVSTWLDCRINAFPPFTNYKEVQICPPNFIFIDLDKKNNFHSSIKDLKFTLSNTLKNINEILGGHPTVLFTGGGYHIYQPVSCQIVLENITEFQGFDRPSEQFLRFTKDNLSNGKADKQNNPSFRSCLLRVPESINFKYDKKVKIVQKWNGIRPQITREFVEEFRTYLIQKKIEEQNYRQKMLKLSKYHNNNSHNSFYYYYYYYDWIEKKILANPFPDCRKIIVDLILAPYLINIKKMSYDESYQKISGWLDKCNSIQKLADYSNFMNYRIHSALKAATQKGIGPMSFYKIKTDDRYNTNLYLLILQKGKLKDEER